MKLTIRMLTTMAQALEGALADELAANPRAMHESGVGEEQWWSKDATRLEQALEWVDQQLHRRIEAKKARQSIISKKEKANDDGKSGSD